MGRPHRRGRPGWTRAAGRGADADPNPRGAEIVDAARRTIRRIAAGLALAGGLLLVGVALLATTSIVGRTAFDAPLTGDFELVGMLTGVAVLCTLPWTQATRGNVALTLLLDRLPARRRLRAFWDVAYAALALLLAWRLTLGGYAKLRSAETSMILGVPAWWPYPVAVLALVLTALVSLALAATGEEEL